MQGDFRIGEWLVEPQINSITGAGRTAHVEPKVMRVLVCLAEHAGEVVPKERLIQSVWADTYVTDDALIRSISELRRVFGDSAKEPRIIQTISRNGYRLLAPVSNDGVPSALPLSTSWGNRLIVPSAAALLVAGAVVSLFTIRIASERSRHNETSLPPLKVVPFTSFGGSERRPSFSPDGNQIAFVWDGEQRDNTDIYVKLIAAGRRCGLQRTLTPTAVRPGHLMAASSHSFDRRG